MLLQQPIESEIKENDQFNRNLDNKDSASITTKEIKAASNDEQANVKFMKQTELKETKIKSFTNI